jgi:hypothetical protein
MIQITIDRMKKGYCQQGPWEGNERKLISVRPP